MISKIVKQTEELDALKVERKVYHAPVARLVNIFGSRLMNGETPWGGQQTVGPASQQTTTYTDGVPGSYGESDDPGNFSKGYTPGRAFYSE